MDAIMEGAQAISWHRGGMFMGMHWLWWLIWIVTVLALIWGILRVSSERSELHRRVEREEAAEEELRRRFARGEIDEEEFKQRLKVLRDSLLGG